VAASRHHLESPDEYFVFECNRVQCYSVKGGRGIKGR